MVNVLVLPEFVRLAPSMPLECRVAGRASGRKNMKWKERLFLAAREFYRLKIQPKAVLTTDPNVVFQ